jgi:hypothetical protein
MSPGRGANGVQSRKETRALAAIEVCRSARRAYADRGPSGAARTGECQPASTWVKASRLHPLIPRESARSRKLYRSRGSVEREFGRLKHEWSLLPLRNPWPGARQAPADLTILAKLACRLAFERAVALSA